MPSNTTLSTDNKPHPLAGKDILFTRQRHDAKRAGLHWDYRLVLGDKAYSWATKKQMPEPGKAIILFETPVHDAVYALRKRIYIPPGQYGSGTTTLDFVRKAKVDQETEPGKIVFSTRDGERYLIKRLDETKYGQASWLFKNLTKKEESEHEVTKLGYTRQILKEAALSELESRFKPDLTPDQMERLGVLRHKGSQYGEGAGKDNFFGVSASMPTWPDKWHNEEHPKGWLDWYINYHKGKRTSDDGRQIKRWLSFKARHLAQLKKADPTLEDFSIQPKRRQALLNWAIGPGIKLEKEAGMNKYLVKIAKKEKSKWNSNTSMIGGAIADTAVSLPTALIGGAIGSRLSASTNIPQPHVADRHTVKHFLRNNKQLSGTTFEHDRVRKGPMNLHDAFNRMFDEHAGIGPAYHAGKKRVYGMGGKGVNHIITMHELGHAKDFSSGRKLKVGLLTGAAAMKHPLIGGIAGIAALSHKDTQDYAPLIPAVSGAITLRSEGAANYHAYKGIKAHKGAEAAKHFLKGTALKNMSNYGLVVTAPVVGAMVANKVIHKLNGDNKKK